MKTKKEIMEVYLKNKERIEKENMIGAAVSCDESQTINEVLKWVLEIELPE